MNRLRLIGLVLAVSAAAPAIAVAADQTPGTTAPTPSHTGAILDITDRISGHILPEVSDEFTMNTRRGVGRANVLMKAHVGGWLGHFANHFVSGPAPIRADIFRVDHAKVYRVLFHRKQYWQCPMEGCPTIFERLDSLGDSSTSTQEQEKDSTWSPNGTDSCSLTPVSHDYTIEDTGQSKTVNGFPAHLYTATFKTVYQDRQGRKDFNTLQWTFWTTPLTGETQKIWAIHQYMANRFLQDSGADKSPWSRFVARKIWRPLDVFLGDTSSHNRDNWTSSVNRKLAQVKGFPVRVKVAWYVDAHACPPPPPHEESDAETLADRAGGGLRGMLGGLIKKHVAKAIETRIEKHFQPKPNEPVFEYDRNILSAKIGPIPDSVFEVPAGFVRTQMPSWPKHAGHAN